MNKTAKRVIAFHLPQFHPFAENDAWWGKGFTEWRNVAKAKPLFRGHYQPHIPADLGFYDLRLPEVRAQQAEMAKEYGIYGFCYYQYWFNGHRLMERPVDEILKSGEPDFPFMLCWANENWTRAWDGGEKEILIKQNYSEDDDRVHMRYLLEHVFSDPRYITVDGKPVFAVYRSTLLPDMRRTIEIWREEAAKAGKKLYLCRVESFRETGAELLDAGFDAAIEFPPMTKVCDRMWHKRSLPKRLAYIFRIACGDKRRMRLFDYGELVEKTLAEPHPDYKIYPCVTPSWDNTSRRRSRMFILRNSTPAKFGHWLREVMRRFKPYSPQENFVFINAWNEWAEGNHLEPDLKWGRQYLEEVKKAVDEEG